MLIESAMPSFDAGLVEHVVVHAGPRATYEAARRLDFLSVRTPLVTVAMWLRGLPARWSGRAGSTPPRLVLSEGLGLPGWLMLGEIPGREIAFGAVGKFWQPAIEWRDIPRADFASFIEPGWGKIAANFTVARYGEHDSLLSYQVRSVTTDSSSRQRFRRYWWLARPFVAHIMRATLRTIRTNAQASA
jgi:hypothetical protein